MTAFGRVLSDAYAAWLDSVSSCCTTMAPCLSSRKPARRGVEKDDFVIYHDQPGSTPPPFAALATTAKAEAMVEPVSARRSHRIFSIQKRFRGRGSSTRGLTISGPTNFQHISTGSLQFLPATRARQRPRSFRPLELSIYAADNHLSPILPLFEEEQCCITPPRPVYTQGSFDSNDSTLGHQRSYPSMSFHLPRRPVGQRSLSSVDPDDTPPRIPPRSRLRSYTTPERVDRMVERIASAMIEREKLQSEIDSIVERQSIYIESRPTTAHGFENLAPMPSIPAMPAAAPSFAERLSLDRPRTAPPKGPVSPISPDDTPPMFDLSQIPTNPRYTQQSAQLSNEMLVERPLAPPLPLVLRPPLRKKKSFSHVSSWLFPGEQQHRRDLSLDSVTNDPRPVTDKDGFYTCVASPDARHSMETDSSVYSYQSDSAEERDTLSTALSPTGSPSKFSKQDTSSLGQGRMATFGQLSINDRQHRPTSVGVAY